MFGELPTRLFALLLAPALIAGCGDEPSEETGDDEAEKRAVHGWVVVERDEADGAVRTSVSAKFIQVSRSSGELASGDLASGELSSAELSTAEELVGVRARVPASGDCVPLRSLEPGQMQASRLSIDLIDVGDVSLSIQEPEREVATKLSLAPRAFPDIGDLVSGVFYTSPDASTQLPVPADYEIEGSGAGGVDAFLIDVRAPEAPRGVTIAGRAVEAATGPLPIDAAADIDLAWAAPAGSLSSLVYVDVRTDVEAGGGHRCTFPDGGGAVLPAGVVPSGAREATLTIHRLAERAVTMQATEEQHPAIVVFDLATTIRLAPR